VLPLGTAGISPDFGEVDVAKLPDDAACPVTKEDGVLVVGIADSRSFTAEEDLAEPEAVARLKTGEAELGTVLVDPFPV
jgi:hypothetical protein